MEEWCQRYLLRSHQQAKQWFDSLANRLQRVVTLHAGRMPEPWHLIDMRGDSDSYKSACIDLLHSKNQRMLPRSDRRDGVDILVAWEAMWLVHEHVVARPNTVKTSEVQPLVLCALYICCLFEGKYDIPLAWASTTSVKLTMNVVMDGLRRLSTPAGIPFRQSLINAVTAYRLCKDLVSILENVSAKSFLTAATANNHFCDLLEWLESGADSLSYADMSLPAKYQGMALIKL